MHCLAETPSSSYDDSGKKYMNRISVILLPVVVIVLLAGYLVADWYQARPVDAPRSYVGRTSCAQCHQNEAERFVDSHHDKAMDLATDTSVLGDFNDQTLEHFGITSRMFRDGDRFMINTEGPDGQMTDFEVRYVFGFTPLQQYMVELEPPTGAAADTKAVGRVQVLRVSWDTKNKKWFYLSPPDVNDKLTPDDPLHWTGITQNWNTSCAECHSTDLKKNYQVTTNEYHTTFSEIDVSCEACHGPASLHVELANENSLFWDRNHGYGLSQLKSVSNVPQVEACAPCHSRRGTLKEGFIPGKTGCNFDDYYALQLLSPPIYFADGQIRDEDYVYGSFLQSKMYHNGIRCTDCHDPHSTKLIHTGNQVCTSCHQHAGGKYDSENHHHHKMGTAGAACVSCHMAMTHYMELDGRRDHSFRVPDPRLSVETGTANACTACHLEFESQLPAESQTAELKQYLDHIIAAENGDEGIQQNLDRINASMAAACEQWYPDDQSSPKSKYYRQLAKGQHEDSAEDLKSLADDKRIPVIVRATAVEAMLGLDVEVDTVLDALQSSDVLVKIAALNLAQERLLNSASSRPGREFKQVLAGVAETLSDKSSRVSAESAWVISMLPSGLVQAQLSSEDRQRYAKALKKYQQGLNTNRDRASAHMMMGGLFERQGETDKAIQAYRNAMSVQPNMTGTRSNLAVLLERQARQLLSDQQTTNAAQRAERLVRQAKELRSAEHQNLGRDVERAKGLANTDGLNYRFGMSSYLQGDLETAEQQLKLAQEKSPDNETYLLGLATFYYQVKKFEAAGKLADRLLELSPNDQQYRALKKAIDTKPK